MNKSSKRKLHLLSNMYPSSTNVRFGIFVKRFEDILKDDFEINKIVLFKNYGVFSKLFGYLKLYLKVVFLYFTASKKDIIYIHFPLYFSVLLLPLVLAKKKIVLNFHGSDIIFDSAIKFFLSFFLYPVVKYAIIVVPSEYYKIAVKEKFGLSDRTGIMIYPSGGVNKTVFYPIKNSQKNFTLGFISNFIESKGWKVFLDAVKMLKDSNTINDLEVIMVGDGPDRKKILYYINELDLNIDLISSVDQNELVNIYSRFNLFIFPTYRKEESLGLVGLEAMMCGVPVIASKVGGPMGYVKDEINGYLFEKKDSTELTEAILKFYELSEEKKLQMKKNCIDTAMKYESNKVVGNLIEMLNKL